MRKVMLLCSLIFGTMTINAQNRSDYETVKSANEGEIIYKGRCTFEDLEHVPAFDQKEDYKPKAKKIKILQEKLRNYRLVVLLGTWCEDSHRLIPQLRKVLEVTNYPMEQLQMFALDRDKKGRAEEEVRYKVANVPTIIVFEGDKEVGRITEIVEKSIESDLAGIIEK